MNVDKNALLHGPRSILMKMYQETLLQLHLKLYTCMKTDRFVTQ